MTDTQKSIQTLFEQGVTQAKAGQKDIARNYIRQVVSLVPTHEAAWLYLAGLAENAESALDALKQVEDINPNNPHLKKAKRWVKRTWSNTPIVAVTPSLPPVTVSKTTKSNAQTITIGVASISIIFVISFTLIVLGLSNGVGGINILAPTMTPTNTLAQELDILRQNLKTAEEAQNQQAIVTILEEMYTLAPNNSEIVLQLTEQYYEQGLALRNGGNFVEAKMMFDQIQRLNPEFEAAKHESELAELYTSGVTYHQQAKWVEAAQTFASIYEQTPNYPYVDEILYSSYFNLGVVRGNEGRLYEAKDAYQRAAKILPDAPEAPEKVTEVSLLLNPPTPTPAPTPTPKPTSTATTVPITLPSTEKRIVVDISEQRAYVYEGNVLAYKFIISTGEPGRDTAVGNFEILNKLPMAYASTWNLDMPFWLGVYWSGPLQNGFHAVPTVRHTGQTMWDGYLGQRVSYGCIILSQEDARTLYNWVDIGTPVTIQW